MTLDVKFRSFMLAQGFTDDELVQGKLVFGVTRAHPAFFAGAAAMAELLAATGGPIVEELRSIKNILAAANNLPGGEWQNHI